MASYESNSTLTVKARTYRSQELTTGEGAVKIVSFKVSTQGYDPNDITTALTPDPTMEELVDVSFSGNFSTIEYLNVFTPVFVCKLAEDEAVGPIGSVALYAEVLNGPDKGQIYLHAVMNIPLYNKSSDDVRTFRFVLPC